MLKGVTPTKGEREWHLKEVGNAIKIAFSAIKCSREPFISRGYFPLFREFAEILEPSRIQIYEQLNS